ncbi:MAG: tRNA (adenosine(37)-N6)-threonylcarbamoyltransferase complex dimerization subunit type 1 TsaB [candidate division KSB1 bacterium]|nr:tRNA (adenosine(37)-N6)-threonylcarbamoyltransferase complex dimerization subunit type 1 TsaB [candidate division KSB1 bacterium]MDZ7301443.1 tRNA (adenosine(37)-N6)-threonylcarbamoyltransferase complex dimerization subunit type 1 TsaB [candidate division KSB1 bacterium]MDZ7310845.1 tRNA (adenosine(37)-N6)-threonylcarbamoyltransferase complex dimerization subunit type 1 TsaB [candidate division KSB1 bacterium]
MILGIETATAICGVGLAEAERVVAEIRFHIRNIHAEVLAESIEHLLRLSGISVNNIDAFAVSIGPGSFTGLRIGLATAKGLAFASSKPIVAVSTLLAQAEASGKWQVASIVPVIKARQNEIYTARFRSAWPVAIAESEEVLLPLSEFPQWLQTPAVLCGNGMPMLQAEGILDKSENITIVPEAAAMLSGGLIARLGAIKFAAGEVADLATLEPRYLQEFEIGPRKSWAWQ